MFADFYLPITDIFSLLFSLKKGDMEALPCAVLSLCGVCENITEPIAQGPSTAVWFRQWLLLADNNTTATE